MLEGQATNEKVLSSVPHVLYLSISDHVFTSPCRFTLVRFQLQECEQENSKLAEEVKRMQADGSRFEFVI